MRLCSLLPVLLLAAGAAVAEWLAPCSSGDGFVCASPNSTRSDESCLSFARLCDGVADCAEGADEGAACGWATSNGSAVFIRRWETVRLESVRTSGAPPVIIPFVASAEECRNRLAVNWSMNGGTVEDQIRACMTSANASNAALCRVTLEAFEYVSPSGECRLINALVVLVGLLPSPYFHDDSLVTLNRSLIGKQPASTSAALYVNMPLGLLATGRVCTATTDCHDHGNPTEAIVGQSVECTCACNSNFKGASCQLPRRLDTLEPSSIRVSVHTQEDLIHEAAWEGSQLRSLLVSAVQNATGPLPFPHKVQVRWVAGTQVDGTLPGVLFALQQVTLSVFVSCDLYDLTECAEAAGIDTATRAQAIAEGRRALLGVLQAEATLKDLGYTIHAIDASSSFEGGTGAASDTAAATKAFVSVSKSAVYREVKNAKLDYRSSSVALLTLGSTTGFAIVIAVAVFLWGGMSFAANNRRSRIHLPTAIHNEGLWSIVVATFVIIVHATVVLLVGGTALIGHTDTDMVVIEVFPTTNSCQQTSPSLPTAISAIVADGKCHPLQFLTTPSPQSDYSGQLYGRAKCQVGRDSAYAGTARIVFATTKKMCEDNEDDGSWTQWYDGQCTDVNLLQKAVRATDASLSSLAAQSLLSWAYGTDVLVACRPIPEVRLLFDNIDAVPSQSSCHDCVLPEKAAPIRVAASGTHLFYYLGKEYNYTNPSNVLIPSVLPPDASPDEVTYNGQRIGGSQVAVKFGSRCGADWLSCLDTAPLSFRPATFLSSLDLKDYGVHVWFRARGDTTRGFLFGVADAVEETFPRSNALNNVQRLPLLDEAMRLMEHPPLSINKTANLLCFAKLYGGLYVNGASGTIAYAYSRFGQCDVEHVEWTDRSLFDGNWHFLSLRVKSDAWLRAQRLAQLSIDGRMSLFAATRKHGTRQCFPEGRYPTESRIGELKGAVPRSSLNSDSFAEYALVEGGTVYVGYVDGSLYGLQFDEGKNALTAEDIYHWYGHSDMERDNSEVSRRELWTLLGISIAFGAILVWAWSFDLKSVDAPLASNPSISPVINGDPDVAEAPVDGPILPAECTPMTGEQNRALYVVCALQFWHVLHILFQSWNDWPKNGFLELVGPFTAVLSFDLSYFSAVPVWITPLIQFALVTLGTSCFVVAIIVEMPSKKSRKTRKNASLEEFDRKTASLMETMLPRVFVVDSANDAVFSFVQLSPKGDGQWQQSPLGTGYSLASARLCTLESVVEKLYTTDEAEHVANTSVFFLLVPRECSKQFGPHISLVKGLPLLSFSEFIMGSPRPPQIERVEAEALHRFEIARMCQAAARYNEEHHIDMIVPFVGTISLEGNPPVVSISGTAMTGPMFDMLKEALGTCADRRTNQQLTFKVGNNLPPGALAEHTQTRMMRLHQTPADQSTRYSEETPPIETLALDLSNIRSVSIAAPTASLFLRAVCIPAFSTVVRWLSCHYTIDCDAGDGAGRCYAGSGAGGTMFPFAVFACSWVLLELAVAAVTAIAWQYSHYKCVSRSSNDLVNSPGSPVVAFHRDVYNVDSGNLGPYRTAWISWLWPWWEGVSLFAVIVALLLLSPNGRAQLGVAIVFIILYGLTLAVSPYCYRELEKVRQLSSFALLVLLFLYFVHRLVLGYQHAGATGRDVIQWVMMAVSAVVLVLQLAIPSIVRFVSAADLDQESKREAPQQVYASPADDAHGDVPSLSASANASHIPDSPIPPASVGVSTFATDGGAADVSCDAASHALTVTLQDLSTLMVGDDGPQQSTGSIIGELQMLRRRADRSLEKFDHPESSSSDSEERKAVHSVPKTVSSPTARRPAEAAKALRMLADAMATFDPSAAGNEKLPAAITIHPELGSVVVRLQTTKYTREDCLAKAIEIDLLAAAGCDTCTSWETYLHTVASCKGEAADRLAAAVGALLHLGSLMRVGQKVSIFTQPWSNHEVLLHACQLDPKRATPWRILGAALNSSGPATAIDGHPWRRLDCLIKVCEIEPTPRSLLDMAVLIGGLGFPDNPQEWTVSWRGATYSKLQILEMALQACTPQDRMQVVNPRVDQSGQSTPPPPPPPISLVASQILRALVRHMALLESSSGKEPAQRVVIHVDGAELNAASLTLALRSPPVGLLSPKSDTL